jgi:hypothetical protein
MVKRTIVVLGILSLLVVGVGTSHAWIGGGWGGCYTPPPLYTAVPCPVGPECNIIKKTWSCKIVGPCPPPFGGAPGYGARGGGFLDNPYGPFSSYGRIGLCGGIVAALATPFDMLFGGFDGVYGCTGGIEGGECGPCFGPVPQVAAGAAMFFAAPTVMFGALW